MSNNLIIFTKILFIYDSKVFNDFYVLKVLR